MLQETFGYYAQGVEPQTAILPEGWKQRFVSFSSPDTNDVKVLCLELHDLWVSKALAGNRKFVKSETLRDRLKMLKGQPTEKIAITQAWVESTK